MKLIIIALILLALLLWWGDASPVPCSKNPICSGMVVNRAILHATASNNR
jgi:hypothetical protein